MLERQTAATVAHLAAWRPVADAIARGDQVGLATIDRAIRSAFDAKRASSETDAAACERLLHQDRDLRLMLSERGAIVGRPIDLPPLEILPVEPIPPAERGGMTPELAKAAGALRSYVCRHRRPRESYQDAKARLSSEPETIALAEAITVETERRE